MNTTIKTVLENGKDFFKEIEELIYKVSGLESELKNEKRLNFLQSEDVIRYGNELQKVNLENKGLYVHVESLNSTLENFQQTLQASEEDNERMRQQIKNKNKFYGINSKLETMNVLLKNELKTANETIKI